jgi:hypothetical protein
MESTVIENANANATATATANTTNEPVQLVIANPFKLVPMKYDLMPVNSNAALNHIRHLTSQNPTSIAPEFMTNLCNTMLYRAHYVLPTVFGYLPAPMKEVTQQVIGTDGYYFKLTTNTSGADFIWHDREHGMFLFWASNNFRIVKAMNAIRWRINKYTNLTPVKLCVVDVPKVEGDVAEDDFDYSDMPELIECDLAAEYEYKMEDID